MPIQNIRVKVSRKYSQLYRDLTSDKPPIRTIKGFDQHRDLFVLCCCLGYRFNVQNDLEKPEDLFWSHSLDTYQETVLKAIAINSTGNVNLNIIHNDADIIRIAEGYADKGMDILLENVLSPYVKEADGKYLIDYNDKSFLQKDLLVFIQGEHKKTPFEY